MQISPVNNYFNLSFGCKNFHRFKKIPHENISKVKLSPENSQVSLEDIEIALESLRTKHGIHKVNNDLEIYTRFTPRIINPNREEKIRKGYIKYNGIPDNFDIKDFTDFIESDFTGNLERLMTQKMKEWRHGRSPSRRGEASALLFISDDARAILKSELDPNMFNTPPVIKNKQIKRDLFRNDRKLFLKLIEDNIMVDYADCMNNSFEKIVQLYKDNPNKEITEDMIKNLLYGS